MGVCIGLIPISSILNDTSSPLSLGFKFQNLLAAWFVNKRSIGVNYIPLLILFSVELISGFCANLRLHEHV